MSGNTATKEEGLVEESSDSKSKEKIGRRQCKVWLSPLKFDGHSKCFKIEAQEDSVLAKGCEADTGFTDEEDIQLLEHILKLGVHLSPRNWNKLEQRMGKVSKNKRIYQNRMNMLIELFKTGRKDSRNPNLRCEERILKKKLALIAKIQEEMEDKSCKASVCTRQNSTQDMDAIASASSAQAIPSPSKKRTEKLNKLKKTPHKCLKATSNCTNPIKRKSTAGEAAKECLIIEKSQWSALIANLNTISNRIKNFVRIVAVHIPEIEQEKYLSISSEIFSVLSETQKLIEKENKHAVKPGEKLMRTKALALPTLSSRRSQQASNLNAEISEFQEDSSTLCIEALDNTQEGLDETTRDEVEEFSSSPKRKKRLKRSRSTAKNEHSIKNNPDSLQKNETEATDPTISSVTFNSPKQDSKSFLYECLRCHQLFGSKSNLTDHVSNNHADLTSYLEILKEDSFSPRSSRIFRFCLYCGKFSENKTSNKNHMWKEHDHKEVTTCVKCERPFTSKSGLQRHVKQEHVPVGHEPLWTGAKRVCDLCGQHFVTEFGFKLHTWSHQDHKRFQCPYCAKKFLYKNSFKQHVQWHTGETPRAPCDICGTMLTLKCMQRHKNRVHSDNRPFKCTICPMAFKSKTNLAYHIASHSNPKRKNRGYNKERKIPLNRKPRPPPATTVVIDSVLENYDPEKQTDVENVLESSLEVIVESADDVNIPKTDHTFTVSSEHFPYETANCSSSYSSTTIGTFQTVSVIETQEDEPVPPPFSLLQPS